MTMPTLSNSLILSEPFLSDLVYDQRERSDGELVLNLLQTLYVQTRYGMVAVPVDFESDGASIPKWARSFAGCPFDKEYLGPGVVHDFLYSRASNHFDGRGRTLSRKESDIVFRDLLWNTKVATWKVPAFYSALRIGGGPFFKKRGLEL